MVFCQKIPLHIKIRYLNIIINITQNNFHIYNVICISEHDKLNNTIISHSSLIFICSLLSLLTYLWSNVLSFIYKELPKIFPLQNGFVAKLNLETLLYTINIKRCIRITCDFYVWHTQQRDIMVNTFPSYS